MSINVLKVAFKLAALLLLCFSVNAQPTVNWSFSSEKTAPTSYNLHIKGLVPLPWHVYGINDGIDGLSAPTLTFDYENVQAASMPAFTNNPQHIKDVIFENKITSVYTDSFDMILHVTIAGTIPPVLKGTVTIYAAHEKEFYPLEQTFNIPLEGASQSASGNKIKLSSVDLNNPLSSCGGQSVQHKSLLGIFLLGFAGGLIALLTPCVFPMVPVTVSFFTKRSANRKVAIRNGLLYGFFIFLIYVLLSLPFHIAGNVNPEIFNTISTNAWLNLIFFAIFIFFALSFFGFFEITLPGSIATKADTKAGIGNIGGIFFMSLTLAIVSFSCTGPILGSLLVGSLSGGAWPLTAGLGGFGAALALPFGVFAIFPNLLKSLPRSGGWLDTVKKVLAFVEVALAFKFFSNADLVMHWGILKRETFLIIWIIVALGLSAYLFGLLRLPHDYKGQKISAGRKITGVVALLFAFYLAPGIAASGAGKLQLLSGFPPPVSYSIYNHNGKKAQGLEANVVNDYERALKLSDSLHKPLLIDFTGWACVNCRKMEENVWSHPAVKSYISENYILVSLYVDDRQKLPVLERFTYEKMDKNKKEIVTYGDRWATFEAENFGQVSQPLYVVVDNDQRLMTNPVGYTPNANEYLTWLQCGKETFDKSSSREQAKNN
jgi:thiol:disulfide interchange protein DsbD